MLIFSHMRLASDALMPCTVVSIDGNAQVVPFAAYAGALCLDGPTLTNLELLESSAGSSEGSLLACLDCCASAGLPKSHPPIFSLQGHLLLALYSGAKTVCKGLDG